MVDHLLPDLLEGWLDGRLDAADRERLLRLLEDPATLAEARVQIATHRAAVESLRADAEVASAWRTCAATLSTQRRARIARQVRRRIDPPRRARTVALIALVAGLAAAIALIHRSRPAPSPADVPTTAIAVVAATPGAGGTVVRGMERLPLRDGLTVHAGDRIETAEVGARLRWLGEATAFDLGAGSAARIVAGDGATRLALDRGDLLAEVAARPASAPMVIALPQAEATVLGTSLALSTRGTAGSLGVTEGRVRFTRRADGRSLTVGAGEYATVGGHGPFTALPLDPGGADLRLVDDHESGLRWARPFHSDPVEATLVPVPGGRALRLAYRHADEPRRRDYGMVVQPLRIAAGERRLRCRVRIEATDGEAILNAIAVLRDGSAWNLGEVRLAHRPPRTWFAFAVPVATARQKNNQVGGDRYDPAEVVEIDLSIFAGAAALLIDDLALDTAPTVPGARP